MRLVFMGTPEYACPSLKKLHEKHDIVMVYSQPDRPSGRGHKMSPPPVKQLALELSLPVHQPVRLNDRSEIEFLKRLNPDCIVVVAYGIILPRDILEIPRLGCINAHGSLLPRHRGASPMQQAILAGDEMTGVTTMLMDEGMDTGDILLMHQTPVAQKTIDQLHDELADLSAELLDRTLELLDRDDLIPQPQNDNQASYTKKISRRDGVVDWSLSAEELIRKWRAYYPWPGLTTTYRGKYLKLVELEALTGRQGQPGTVTSLSDQGIDISTGNGILRIKQLQPAGKRVMTVSDFLRGNHLATGDKLGD
ncbi:MAG: methionyl-tRNA formyltransferase [Tissierellia bacterium]|jgi:methionyl-tRNA formyltransferase|nr:methionyl-tRNA formyltransferase [Tissierellia bacterium]